MGARTERFTSRSDRYYRRAPGITLGSALPWVLLLGLGLMSSTALFAQEAPPSSSAGNGCGCFFPEHCCSDGVGCCRWANSFGLSASSYMPDEQHLEQGFLPGLQFEYRVNDRFGLQTSIERFESELEGATDVDVDQVFVDLSANWWLGRGDGRVQPMLFGGVGWAETQVDSTALALGEELELNDSWTVNAGVGLHYELTDSVYIRPQVKGRWLETSGYLDWSVGASVGFTFGDRYQAPPSGTQGKVVDLRPDPGDGCLFGDERTLWSWSRPSTVDIYLDIPKPGTDVIVEIEGPSGIYKTFNVSAPPALPQFNTLEVDEITGAVAVRAYCRESSVGPCLCSFDYKVTVKR